MIWQKYSAGVSHRAGPTLLGALGEICHGDLKHVFCNSIHFAMRRRDILKGISWNSTHFSMTWHVNMISEWLAKSNGGSLEVREPGAWFIKVCAHNDNKKPPNRHTSVFPQRLVFIQFEHDRKMCLHSHKSQTTHTTSGWSTVLWATIAIFGKIEVFDAREL